MKVNIEYDPNDPEEVIHAERIIKCNNLTSVLWNMMYTDKKDFTHETLTELLEANSIDIDSLWS